MDCSKLFSRGKPTLFVPLKEILDVKTASLINGSGQNSETLTRQKKILEDRKRKTLANAKIFEELERKGDEELSKDLVKQYSKPAVPNLHYQGRTK